MSASAATERTPLQERVISENEGAGRIETEGNEEKVGNRVLEWKTDAHHPER